MPGPCELGGYRRVRAKLTSARNHSADLHRTATKPHRLPPVEVRVSGRTVWRTITRHRGCHRSGADSDGGKATARHLSIPVRIEPLVHLRFAFTGQLADPSSSTVR